MKNPFRNYRKHKGFKRFIVLSRSRTGSNLLISYLRSHPNIRAKGEVFSELEGKDFESELRNAFGRPPLEVKASGFKLFYYHPLDCDCPELWDMLKSMQELHVIHLKRHNLLHVIVSAEMAKSSDIWLRQDEATIPVQQETKTLSFDSAKLLKAFELTKEWEIRGEELFQNHPLISVEYEDLAKEPTTTFKEVTEFLGVQYSAPETKLVKQNRRRMKEIIVNYNELQREFEQTKWSTYFDE